MAYLGLASSPTEAPTIGAYWKPVQPGGVAGESSRVFPFGRGGTVTLTILGSTFGTPLTVKASSLIGTDLKSLGSRSFLSATSQTYVYQFLGGDFFLSLARDPANFSQTLDLDVYVSLS